MGNKDSLEERDNERSQRYAQGHLYRRTAFGDFVGATKKQRESKGKGKKGRAGSPAD